MLNQIFSILKSKLYIILLLLFFSSCNSNKWVLPQVYVGKWFSPKSKITVRTKPHFASFEFTSDSAAISIRINSDKTADGSIGSAVFTHGMIRKNRGNPERTGVSYIIECGEIGKIFKIDPKERKEVELWLGPISKNGTIEGELRYTEGMSQFPMAGFELEKARN
ncbi:MAG: hypothetical protein HXX13_03350 [Bacteroidetes bacterium]|nr:hypothetical protein [Bacteroidota bacterium]